MKGRQFPEFPVVNKSRGVQERMPKTKTAPFTSLITSLRRHFGPSLMKCKIMSHRAVRYDDIYRMDEIKSLSFHIMLYRLFRGVAKYIVYAHTFSSFG